MLTYTKGTGAYENWILGEDEFCMHHQKKAESILCLSNGYLGIRSAFEEAYPYQARGMFVAGCYNRYQTEPTELPNAADSCEMKIFLDGRLFSMAQGKTLEYSRYLNLYTGELQREVLWQSSDQKRYRLLFRRCVSAADSHAYGMQVSITSLDQDAVVSVENGINARMTNSGVQHFDDGAQKVLENSFLYLEQKTTESCVVLHHCCGTVICNGEEQEHSFSMKRKLLIEKRVFRVKKGETACFEKVAVLYTSRDFGQQEYPVIQKFILDKVQTLRKAGYRKLFLKSAKKMSDYWNKNDILIEAEDSRIQLAVRFAQYHLRGMCPLDSSCSIAAKGLSGEGYKGHVFWDTEVFLLPYFLYTDPPRAKQLLEYRIRRMVQAADNAAERGYRGLMFPWESADSGKEETPLFASMDILTGKAAPVWAGLKEHHITADIAYAVWTYYSAAMDEVFMEAGGAEMIIGSALFWLSRSVYSEEKQRYEILDIIGPDEYTEHINNNAYTNYMVYEVVKRALVLLEAYPQEKRKNLEEKFRSDSIIAKLTFYMEHLYLPKPLENGVLPQNDSFMEKNIIDIEAYRRDDIKQTILKQYSREQVNDMQVLKQADTVMLHVLWPDLFNTAVRKADWNYYEPKTIHDSSLSQAVYSIAASDNREPDKAYESFLQAMDIDMGRNPSSSDEGIHAASMGGIWMAVIRGFAGIRVRGTELLINPCLPTKITSLNFEITVWNKRMKIRILPHQVFMTSDCETCIQVNNNGVSYDFTHQLIIQNKQ